MLLKLVILILLVALIASLFSGLFYLMKDTDNTGRVFTALSFRIGLTVALMLLVTWGFWSGQLGWNTPWLH